MDVKWGTKRRRAAEMVEMRDEIAALNEIFAYLEAQIDVVLARVRELEETRQW